MSSSESYNALASPNAQHQELDTRDIEANQLEEIYHSTLKIKSHAQKMNAEIEDQSTIISSLESEMESGTSEIAQRIKYTRSLNKIRAKNCRLYAVIILLIIILTTLIAY